MKTQIRAASRGMKNDSLDQAHSTNLMESSSFESLQNWVQEVNARWLVHSTLKEKSRDWIEYLSTQDHHRWKLTCRLVWTMMEGRGKLEDPKPRFYGALFAFAKEEEAKVYLREHLVTRALLPCFHDDPGDWTEEEIALLNPEVIERLEKLRVELKNGMIEIQKITP